MAFVCSLYKELPSTVHTQLEPSPSGFLPSQEELVPMDIKHAAPSALPSSWTIPQTVNMKDHGRKSTWTTQLSPYLRGLKIKNLMSSPKSPKSSRDLLEEASDFRIIHTPDRPERPISRTAIPTDEQCMEFLMSLQRQEEHKRGGIKTGLKMWPYPEEETEGRRYLRSVRVESVQFEEARLARTNSSGPARMVEVGRSSTKSTLATPSVSDEEEDDNESIEEPRMSLHAALLSPPPTLSRDRQYLDVPSPRANTSRWSDDSIESMFSSREHDSPCAQRGTLRSSAGASSPTVFGDDSVEPSTPPQSTPVKDRPATPFTDPRLRAVADPITPPPSDHVAHLIHVSPEPLPRKHSWSSSRDTVLNTGAPISRFQSWLPEARPREEVRKQHQDSEPEVYGDWADYYFEDGNFWDEHSDGEYEEDETRVEEDIDADDERNEVEAEEKDQGEEEEKDQKDRLHVGEKVYPRYESFIEDYKKNIMNITVTEV
ncbi:aspartate aminotransferase [Colletotrichum tofieldiae]|nr:aspartate aminotransferase [Colletotrichum tofieldiae]GKT77860.1 aspartate aminotransferase [Colletotrichum tofieldiae]